MSRPNRSAAWAMVSSGTVIRRTAQPESRTTDSVMTTMESTRLGVQNGGCAGAKVVRFSQKPSDNPTDTRSTEFGAPVSPVIICMW